MKEHTHRAEEMNRTMISFLLFACIGSAWGTGRAGIGISMIGISKPDVRARAPAARPGAARRRHPPARALTHPPSSRLRSS